MTGDAGDGRDAEGADVAATTDAHPVPTLGLPAPAASGAPSLSTDAAEALVELLNDAAADLLGLGRRVYVLEAFTAELNKVSRARPFDVQNDVVWRMVFDTRDVAVIGLASWSKAALAPGGLVGLLRNKFGRCFPRKRRVLEPEHRFSAGQRDEFHAAAFERLFGGTTKPPPNHDAFVVLKERLDAGTSYVRADRSAKRAHPYEDRTSTVTTVDVLEAGKLRESYDFLTGLLNDLCLVSGRTTWSFHDMNFVSSARAAAELVDHVLLGLVPRSSVDRERLYAAMHAAETHEAKAFNGEAGRRAMREFLEGPE